jgi:hypothetical protein
MKSTKIILCFLACFGFAYRVDSQATPASKPTVIAASTALDGRGGCCVGLRPGSPTDIPCATASRRCFPGPRILKAVEA